MIPKLVRKLSYVSAVRSVIRSVGLQRLAQKLYHQQALPSDGILRFAYSGYQAKFFCPSVSQVRGLELFSSGSDAEFRRLLSFVRPNDVFFDIGAQYGVYSFLVADAFGSNARVVAFEPFPTEYALLQKNVELNEAATHVQIVNVALSDHDGSAAMSNEDTQGVFCPRIGTPAAGSCTVGAARGDTLISTGRIPFPNVVKLDVEGHELAVLRGMSEALGDPRCHGIYCEIHDDLLPAGEHAGLIMAFLKSKGFNSISEKPGSNHHLFAEKI